MGKQNSTLTVVGKVGNMVGYKGRGKTLARIRQTDVKYSNTEAQAIQRMITATNARAYSRLKEICDHSFEGVAYRQLSQDFFLKQNAKILRQWVADNYPTVTESDPSNYVGLSGKSDGFASGVGLLISKGTLGTIPAVRDPSGLLFGFGTFVDVGESDDLKIGQLLESLTAVEGDQITLVGLKDDGTLHLSRYVLNTEITTAQKEAVVNESSLSAIINAEKSKLGSLSLFGRVSGDGGIASIAYNDMLFDELAESGLVGFAIILSRKAADGTWLRSTQRLLWAGDSDVAGLESPEYCIEEWTAGTTQINTNNRWYLNQAQNS